MLKKQALATNFIKLNYNNHLCIYKKLQAFFLFSIFYSKLLTTNKLASNLINLMKMQKKLAA